ncbi:apolipo C-II [Pelobates cultripes]|uniref:Apolipoprotein C-II n=1 Tax=Pelobates cultripes TaxID=61616 RepID=A0AAD1TAH1_PELCU|nr:apolipo C-II [Pelobates cultripes]
MNPTQVTAVSLLLLLLSTGIQSYRIQKREEPPTYLSQVQNVLSSSFEQASTKAKELFDKVRIPAVEEKVKDAYEKTSSYVTPYLNIFYDQAYHWLYE